MKLLIILLSFLTCVTVVPADADIRYVSISVNGEYKTLHALKNEGIEKLKTKEKQFDVSKYGLAFYFEQDKTVYLKLAFIGAFPSPHYYVLFNDKLEIISIRRQVDRHNDSKYVELWK